VIVGYSWANLKTVGQAGNSCAETNDAVCRSTASEKPHFCSEGLLADWMRPTHIINITDINHIYKILSLQHLD
jgi:hypothetical protein